MNVRFLKFILLSVSMLLLKYASAQSIITFDAGQVFSTYKFLDNQGVEEKNFTNNIGGCFNLGYQHASPNGLFIRSNLGMRKAGASLIIDETTVNWNVQYADVNAGLGYIINKWRVKPYISASPYFAYMLKGQEMIGPDNYDIIKTKSMQLTDFGVFVSPGLKVSLSNSIAFYAEYKYILGLQNLENSGGQKSYNRGFSLNLGISVSIIRYNYVTTH